MINKYCVYEHWLDGECIYVGSGLVSNKRYNPKYKRNHVYEEVVKNRRQDIKVIIVKYFDNKEDSVSFEEAITRKYREKGYAKCNLKNGNKNQIISENQRRKISEYMKINNPSTIYGAPNKGVPMSEYQKQKIANTIISKNELYKKMIICIEDNIVFKNCYQAAEYYKIDIRIIKKNCENNSIKTRIKKAKKNKKTYIFVEDNLIHMGQRR